MIPVDELILLDTNILIHLIRGNDLGQWIDETYHLRSRKERPLISIITVGEAQAFALKLNWGTAKRTDFQNLLRELVIVDINSSSVINKYADFVAFSENSGRPMGQNDYWIAATAAATDSHLFTTDKDFDHLCPAFIKRVFIDPQSYKC